ncbi:MAG TPA: phytanoyl-CoA dioxygenase family protein [Capsulimonadaceae bacterium]|jgi:hypothetical protein
MSAIANDLYPQLSSSGVALDISEDSFGELRSSIAIAFDPDALRTRMLEDGYLYLPGFLDRPQVQDVRAELVSRLAAAGVLAPGTDPSDAIANLADKRYFMPELATQNVALMDLLYGEDGRLMEFYRELLGGEVRHYDFTWMRAVGPGGATHPHCDIVYMGRGTTNLYTAWIPYTDVSWEIGGLMILEGSHKNGTLKNTYGRKDVDAWCENRKPAYEGMGRGGNIGAGGRLTDNPARIRTRLGGRWLSAQFRMGDLLTFPMYTVHASLDNRSDVIRLSSDTRYQLASEPVDERWVGEKPIGHGPAAARGMIC